MDHSHVMTNQTNGFCSGTGRVMSSGFQFEVHGAPCILFLIPGFNIDSSFKYQFTLLICFLMGVLNEGLSLFRRKMAIFLKNKTKHTKLICSLVYGFQMILSYSMMLLVMTFHVRIFFSLIVGVMFGNFVFNLNYFQSKQIKTDKPPKESTNQSNKLEWEM
jgi:hypothetical protein